MFKQIILAASVATLGALAACQTANPDVVQRNDAQRMSSVQDGTVLSIRDVTIDGSQTGGGAAAGAIAGGVAGSNVGRSPTVDCLQVTPLCSKAIARGGSSG